MIIKSREIINIKDAVVERNFFFEKSNKTTTSHIVL